MRGNRSCLEEVTGQTGRNAAGKGWAPAMRETHFP